MKPQPSRLDNTVPPVPAEPEADPDACVHILNPLWNDYGGSELRALQLCRILLRHTQVRLWSENQVAPGIAAAWPVDRINPAVGDVPQRGTLVIVGTYYTVGEWVRNSTFRRIILIHNIARFRALLRNLRALRRFGHRNIEIVYSAERYRRFSPFAGRVEDSPINIDPFLEFDRPPRPLESPFVAGRHSRDHPEKHHPRSPELFLRLAENGIQTRVMGGLCLEKMKTWRPDSRVELLEAGAMPVAAFLRGIDCFLYMTSRSWRESFGRVIFEAMASGMPVVAERRHGYGGHIRDGENGLLVRTPQEAFDAVCRLRDDPGLARAMGAAGRRTVVELYDPAWREEMIRYYLGPGH